MIDLHIIDYCDLLKRPEMQTTWSLAGNKLIKAGCRMTIKGCKEDMDFLYQQMRSILKVPMVTSESGE